MVKEFPADLLSDLATTAQGSARQRSHLNVHSELDANVQRLFIATQPTTYMRPHCHSEAHKWEFFTVLSGHIDLLIFTQDGCLEQRIEMSTSKTRAVEIPPGTWHAYVCMESNTLALEVKEGAYIPSGENDFAPWSPPESSEQAVAFLASMRSLKVGETLNSHRE